MSAENHHGKIHIIRSNEKLRRKMNADKRQNKIQQKIGKITENQ